MQKGNRRIAAGDVDADDQEVWHLIRAAGNGNEVHDHGTRGSLSYAIPAGDGEKTVVKLEAKMKTLIKNRFEQWKKPFNLDFHMHLK